MALCRAALQIKNVNRWQSPVVSRLYQEMKEVVSVVRCLREKEVSALFEPSLYPAWGVFIAGVREVVVE